MNTIERRKSNRVESLLPCFIMKVSPKGEENTTFGRVMDVSRNGFFLDCWRMEHVTKTLNLEITMPWGEKIRCMGVVKNQDTNPGRHRKGMGIELFIPSPTTGRAWSKLYREGLDVDRVFRDGDEPARPVVKATVIDETVMEVGDDDIVWAD